MTGKQQCKCKIANANNNINSVKFYEYFETEKEFIRATSQALEFYAKSWSDLRIILWSAYDKPPIYDGKVSGCLDVFNDYSSRTDPPKKDDDARREAKIKYLEELK